MSRRTISIMTRTYRQPGIKGLKVQHYLLIKCNTTEEARAIATAAIDKARGAEIIDSEEHGTGAVEVHGLSATSILDTVLTNATLTVAAMDAKADKADKADESSL